MTSKYKILTIFLLLFSISGCATPVSYTNVPLATYDKDTEYNIEETDKGFALTIYYSRFQFFPESDAVAVACKSQLTAIAWEHADKLNRKIVPINEQRIKLSMGRNGVSGITSCQAYVTAEWEK